MSEPLHVRKVALRKRSHTLDSRKEIVESRDDHQERRDQKSEMISHRQPFLFQGFRVDLPYNGKVLKET